MKRAIYISILCTVMLTACGNVSESTKRAETSDVSQTTTTLTTSAATAKEEKDTSETATTIKSSQRVSENSKPTGTTVTTTKKSGSSNANGNSNQGQNNNGQENNYQPVQNDPQPDNSPSDNNRSNNGAEQNNDPTPPTTTAKPAVTNPPTTTTPKPQITVPQTEPPEVVIEDTTNLQSVLNYVNSLGRSIDEYYNIGAGLSHDGSDYGKAEAVYNWIRDNVSGNCQVFSVATMYACKGIGLECRYAFFSPDDWYGHMANLVNVGGAWYVFDTQGGRFLKSDKYGDITRIFDENDNTIELSVSESAY
ncbi:MULTISPECIES: transglutaminase-like domain-containing protein [Ruminococcus]|uniref:transglutaminase-like domain-containing protein n=1 Tax=Ruminococcus TaxID=1263 RepID=UPI001897AFA7|nr:MULTISPECIES: transglutaminase-like domain-containing protein [Ruminococcus]